MNDMGSCHSNGKNFRNDSTILPKGDERIKERFRAVVAELSTPTTRQALNYAWKTPMSFYRTHSVNEAVKELKSRR